MQIQIPHLRRRIHRWTVVSLLTINALGFGVIAHAQKPQAQLPNVYLNTTWNPPTGGTTWAAHTAAQLTTALASSQPGDVIVLDAGATYTGNFYLQPKTNPNNQWIYIMSSAINSLPSGQWVTPSETANMAKIVTTNVGANFQVNGGANHYRLAGLELTTASTYGCNSTHNPPINCFSYFLVGSQSFPTPLPDSITIDRCYIHGSPTMDLQTAVQATGSNYAVVDSYISDVHMYGADNQAIGFYYSPGPYKIVDNYLSAAGENILIGGAGGNNDLWVPSDIQIQYNYLYKPLSWATAGAGGTLSPSPQWVEKNAFEVKSAQRVLFDSNVIQNVWAAGQNGYAIVLTVRSSQDGDIAVVNDITVTNNALYNVVAGVNSLAEDDQCGAAGGYPNCHNPGSQDRWNISNNLFQFYDPTQPGGMRNVALATSGGLNRLNGNTPGTIRDIVFQHNTSVSAASTPCWESIYFSTNGQAPPFTVPISQNIWLLDNALCRQPTGDWGYQGTTGLNYYMGLPNTSPNDLTHRYYGNEMYVPSGDKVQSFPAGNLATTTAFTYVNPSAEDYQILAPIWTTTSDGQQAGINNNTLPSVVTLPPPSDDRPQ